MPGKQTDDSIRGAMRDYWRQYDASVESMMLSSHASRIQSEERSDILTLLPDIHGKRVLELGAGIGRFTGKLAKYAKHVTAVDFMESYVEENKCTNGHLSNITFQQADVTELELQTGTYDVIFSNWLVMYLSDEEMVKLATKIPQWLSPDGYVFIRESCYRPSGNVKRSKNPTFYRSPRCYAEVFTNSKATNEKMHLIRASCVPTYIKHFGNPFQVCFLFSKMAESGVQKFLDENQYSKKSIQRYEQIFGETFVSTGGLETCQELYKSLSLKPDAKLLDVGCGVGGSAFYLARIYGVNVTGVDLSTNMVELALQYQDEQEEAVKKRVAFEIADITKREFEPESFDVIISRDTILHIEDKLNLFRRFLSWLRPGGQLLITDYCRGRPASEELAQFTEYVAQRGYHLKTVEDYGKLLTEAGFNNVKAINKTSDFISILKRELTALEAKQEHFTKKFSHRDYAELQDGWISKIERCRAGDQAWGLFLASK